MCYNRRDDAAMRSKTTTPTPHGDGGLHVSKRRCGEMARAQRICSHPSCGLTAKPGNGLCRTHAAERDAKQRRTTPTKRTRDWAEYNRRRKTVTQWRAAHGNICPGYKRPPHPATDLTAEHITPVADILDGNSALSVLCRSCNSRHGAETSNKYQNRT